MVSATRDGLRLLLIWKEKEQGQTHQASRRSWTPGEKLHRAEDKHGKRCGARLILRPAAIRSRTTCLRGSEGAPRGGTSQPSPAQVVCGNRHLRAHAPPTAELLLCSLELHSLTAQFWVLSAVTFQTGALPPL